MANLPLMREPTTKLAEAIEASGAPAYKAAEAMGVSAASVSDWCAGHKVPDLESALLIEAWAARHGVRVLPEEWAADGVRRRLARLRAR